jgi:hypothetical protein
VAGIHVESSVLPALGWLPENGQPGQPAVNVNAAQNFSRGFPRVSRNWAVPTIGWIQQLLPLQDIWRFGYGQTRVPYGPYQGGEKANEQGGTEFGVNSSPMAIPQIGG